MTKQLTLAGLLALTLSGCAYSTAMRTGDKAAAAGDWRTAEAEYRKATDKKDKEEALAAWQSAKEQAIADALDGALTSLDRGAYESAMSDIEYVMKLDSDNADVYTLKSDVRNRMKQDISNHWDLGNIRTSYTTAVRMKALFPSEDSLPEWFGKLRQHFEDEAKGHLKQKRFEDALASARTIVEFEPNRANHVAPLEHEILTGWADDMTKKAWGHNRAGRKGAAAMLYARAYEIAGRQPDLANAQDLASQLAGKARFDMSLRITGNSTRAKQIRTAIESKTDSLTDFGNASKDALTVTISAAGNRCSEVKESVPEAKDYISGQIEVDNPRHGELTAKLAHAEQAAIESKAESERLWPEVQKAERSLKFFDELVAMGNKELNAAQSKMQQAQGQLQKLETKRAEIETHLQELALVGPGTEATVAAREKERAKVLNLIAQWQGVVMDEEFKVKQAQREVEGLQVERDPAAAAFERINGGYKAVLDDWQTYQKTASETKSTLANTPKTVMEDVHETLDYEVHTWTRTCSAPVSVTMRPTWRTDLETSETFTPEGTTRDSSHRGHDLAQLVEDPKEYPQTDAELWASSDAQTAEQIGTWIAEMVEDFYEVRTLETTMAMQKDPLRATDKLVGLYLGAPAHVDDSTILTFKTHAREHFGLDSLELLRSESAGNPLASR